MYRSEILFIETHSCCAPFQAMLRQYGSSVDEEILTKLVSAFSELRQLADEGLIAYPYSTREVVNIVRHIQVSTWIEQNL